MKPGRVLFIANGHGEDTVAAYLMEELRRRAPVVEVCGFPLVGLGEPYQQRGLPLVPATDDAPRHGFGPHTAEIVWRLLSGNWLFITPQQRRAAAQLRGRFDLAVTVGDGVPALVARWLKLPFIYVGVNKTDYYREFGRGYMAVELPLMRRARKVFTRDTPTAESLRHRGVPRALCVGNPMMDRADEPAAGLLAPVNGWRIVLLPGSYQDTLINLEDMLAVLVELESTRAPGERLNFVVAAPGHLSARALAENRFAGWEFVADSAGGESPRLGEFMCGQVRVPVFRRGFWELARAADLVLGLAGTANEQCAGLGKPVVSFPSRGVQYTRGFGITQVQLLGEALSFQPRGAAGVARRMLEILRTPELRERMSAAGRQRMERGHACARITDEVLAALEEVAPA